VWSVARRPRWIVALLLALGIAAGFAALGQWQIGRAVQTGTVVIIPDEKITPLADVSTPQ
jgi:surfeit locus 1 family protein